MDVCAASDIFRPDNTALEKKRELIYLGGLVTCDGRVSAELNRRLSEGKALFRILNELWSHTSVSRKWKLQIFNACIISKVMYGLESLWLLKSDKMRVDAFHCMCLRKIVGVLPSYYSRVTNESILKSSCQVKLSLQLENRQKRLFEKIQTLPISSQLRNLVCDEVGNPKDWAYRRGRGRPRQRWSRSVHRLFDARANE